MIYDLIPTNGRLSFYGKARVEILEDGTKILFSYGVKIMTIKNNGEMIRHWNDWTNTTGTHIKSFCGLCKKDFLNLQLVTM